MQNPQAVSHPNRSAIIISMLFNAYWFVCVVFQEQAWFLLLGLLIGGIVFDKTVAIVAPIIALIGICGDALLTGFGVFIFDKSLLQNVVVESNFIEALSSFPLWLGFLWLGFGTYAWLLRNVLIKHAGILFIALCSFAGSSSYYAGMKLGAVDFSLSLTTTLMVLLALWAFYGWFFATLISFLSTRVFKETHSNLLTSREPFFSVDAKR
jgi:hypothetical protein